MKIGIAALAEVYGQTRPEFHQLKELAGRLIDHLHNELGRVTSSPIDLGEVAETAESFAAFCADASFPQCFILFSGDKMIAVLRADREFSLALVDAVLGPDRTQARGGPARSMTITETRILETMLVGAFTAAVQRAFGETSDDYIQLQVIPATDLARLESVELPDNIVAASARCLIGSRNCAIGIGLPLVVTLEGKAEPPTAIKNGNYAGGVAKTGNFLSAAPMELRAVLGTVAISLAEIRAFAAGSVIMLHKLNAGLPRVELNCGGQVLFSGTVVEDRGWHKFLIQQRGE